MRWFAGRLFGDQTEMLSFRVQNEEAAEARRWAMRLGVHRSELPREALHPHLLRLPSENDAAILG